MKQDKVNGRPFKLYFTKSTEYMQYMWYSNDHIGPS